MGFHHRGNVNVQHFTISKNLIFTLSPSQTLVIQCQICMIFLDPLKNVIFMSYHQNQVPCDVFQPNSANPAHFRDHLWLWLHFRALWGSLSFWFRLNFSNFFSLFYIEIVKLGTNFDNSAKNGPKLQKQVRTKAQKNLLIWLQFSENRHFG